MTIDYLKIDQKNKIPVYLFGSQPELLLMAGMHGNEKTGVVILQKIIKQLKNGKQVYPVAIIPCVNLSAYKKNSRINPKDKIDLNRIFPVVKINSQSYRIAKALQVFSENFGIVIDIHVFTGQNTLRCGVDLNIAKGDMQKKIQNMMSRLGLEAICRIDHASEPKKDGSLCAYLQNKRILAFGIELPPLEVLTDSKLEKIKFRLMNLIKNFSKTVKVKKLKSYTRRAVVNGHTGLFLPNKNPGHEIKKGDIIGSILGKNKRNLSVRSPFSGKLISISYKKPVNDGDKLFVIGKK